MLTTEILWPRPTECMLCGPLGVFLLEGKLLRKIILNLHISCAILCYFCFDFQFNTRITQV